MNFLTVNTDRREHDGSTLEPGRVNREGELNLLG